MKAELHSHGEAAHDRLERSRTAILESIDQQPRTAQNIAIRSGIDVLTTSAILDDLTRSGTITRRGTTISVYQRPPDDERRVHPAPA